VEKNTTETVMAVEMIRLFIRACRNGTVAKTSTAFSRKLPPGRIAGGTRLVSEDCRLPITNDHQSGNAAPAKKAKSRP